MDIHSVMKTYPLEAAVALDPIEKSFARLSVHPSNRAETSTPFPSSELYEISPDSFDVRGSHSTPRGFFGTADQHQYTKQHDMEGDNGDNNECPLQGEADLIQPQNRAAERRVPHSQMWPDPATVPLAASVASYELGHEHHYHNNSNSINVWRHADASPLPREAKLAEMWPRRTSAASPSTWLDDYYYKSAVADVDDVFSPKQHHGPETPIQLAPGLPTVPDGTIDSLPWPSRQSRQSFHSTAAQQKQAAQASVQNEIMMRSSPHPGRLAMHRPRQQQRSGGFPSDVMPMPYQEEQFYTTPFLGRADYHQPATAAATAVLNNTGFEHRNALAQKDSNSLFSDSFLFQEKLQNQPHEGQQRQKQQRQILLSANEKIPESPTAINAASTGPNKTFKPMQMVFREGRRASASSTGTSNSSGKDTGTGMATPATADTVFSDTLMYQSNMPVYPSLCSPTLSSLPPISALPIAASVPLPLEEQNFRRQQGISLNYRGDIHNPHNRGDHIPALLNTSLFLMGLPPRATVGDLLRAVVALGRTGRVFAASVNPPDPARRLPLAAAKISFFTRPQAERLKAQIDAQQLVMYDEEALQQQQQQQKQKQQYQQLQPRALVIRCAWNRDKKPPRQCVQASECRVLRIRGPADVVNYEALTAYFDEKFRYELQDVRVVMAGGGGGSGNKDTVGEQTMEWRFASFQSQAIAAKMALNQERKMVRVEYGRDPCEWGEC